METIKSPGSLLEFSSEHQGSDPAEVTKFYGEALSAYRKSLAEARGVHPDELHAMPLADSSQQLVFESFEEAS